ncbi:MAG: IS3 family transposase [Pyrinomonadaceae bacterium]
MDKARRDGARLSEACRVAGITDRTYRRWKRDGMEDARKNRVFAPANKLDAEAREMVLEMVNSEMYGSLPVSQIVPLMADEGIYLASESTIYRIMRENGQTGHRLASRARTERPKPRPLKATAPNQVWVWDITYLRSAVHGVYWYLYMITDLYSRFVVGWRVFDKESGRNAAELFEDTLAKRGVGPAGLKAVHSDNGAPMKSHEMVALLDAMEIPPSFSRARVSNDNPHAEAQFRVAKYIAHHPTQRSETIEDAEEWSEKAVSWMNHGRLHSRMRFLTPASIYYGRETEILQKREAVYREARQKHPARWAGNTRNWNPVTEVCLNPSDAGNGPDKAKENNQLFRPEKDTLFETHGVKHSADSQNPRFKNA